MFIFPPQMIRRQIPNIFQPYKLMIMSIGIIAKLTRDICAHSDINHFTVIRTLRISILHISYVEISKDLRFLFDFFPTSCLSLKLKSR